MTKILYSSNVYCFWCSQFGDTVNTCLVCIKAQKKSDYFAIKLTKKKNRVQCIYLPHEANMYKCQYDNVSATSRLLIE
jgi:hypothetical protein